MRKLSIFFFGLIFIYLFYGILISAYDFQAVPKDLSPRQPEHFYDYAGVLNVHTSQSTGSGSFDSVIQQAQAADLDFIILTDLNNFDKQKELEGYYGRLLVFVGGEYNYLDSRLLNFDASQTDQLMGRGRAQMVFAELLSRENISSDYGYFILAHPLKPGYGWRGEYPVGLSGIEVFNLKSIWQWSWMNDRAAFIGNLLVYPFNPNLAVVRIFAESSRAELALWDQLNQRRRTVGFAGADAEARVRLFGRPFDLPSYRALFSIMRNHVLVAGELTGSSTSDKRKIADALKNGQFYMSLDLLGDPKGFSSYAKDKNGKILPLGSVVKYASGLELIADLPNRPSVPFETIIYKNGEKVLTSTSALTSFALHGPGSYRTVVRLKITLPPPGGRIWVPWIFTNPIHIQ